MIGAISTRAMRFMTPVQANLALGACLALLTCGCHNSDPGPTDKAGADKPVGIGPGDDATGGEKPGAIGPGDGSSGLEGHVVVSPAHGGPSPIDQPDEAPWRQATFIVRQGRLVTKFTTDDEGHFRIPLPPGKYQIQLDDPPALTPPDPEPWTVEIAPGRFEQVRWVFDTGIR